MIKSRILRWAGHVARMEGGRNAFKILTGKPTGRTLEWILNKYVLIQEIGFIQLRIGITAKVLSMRH